MLVNAVFGGKFFCSPGEAVVQAAHLSYSALETADTASPVARGVSGDRSERGTG